MTYGVHVVTYEVHVVTYGVHVVTYGVHVVTYEVHVVTYGVHARIIQMCMCMSSYVVLAGSNMESWCERPYLINMQ